MQEGTKLNSGVFLLRHARGSSVACTAGILYLRDPSSCHMAAAPPSNIVMHQPHWPLWDHIDGNKKYSQELPSLTSSPVLSCAKLNLRMSLVISGQWEAEGIPRSRRHRPRRKPTRRASGLATPRASPARSSIRRTTSQATTTRRRCGLFYLEYSLGDLCAGPFQAIPASIERVEKAEKVDFRRQQFLGDQLCIRPNQCVGHFSVPFTSLL